MKLSLQKVQRYAFTLPGEGQTSKLKLATITISLPFIEFSESFLSVDTVIK
jgi:hypothetical protein